MTYVGFATSSARTWILTAPFVKTALLAVLIVPVVIAWRHDQRKLAHAQLAGLKTSETDRPAGSKPLWAVSVVYEAGLYRVLTASLARFTEP
jgi:hypothetical protein